MARVQVNIRFLYEGVLFTDALGYIPRHEAIKIPELKVEENQSRVASNKRTEAAVKQAPTKNKKNKKQSDAQQQILQQNQYDENMQMDVQDGENQNQNYGQVEVDQMDLDEQQQMEQLQNLQNQYQNDEQEEEDDDIDDENQDNDLSEISRSLSPNVTYGKYKTKRQQGQVNDFLQLPLKKPRKDAKKFDEATELIRKQQKQRKRRQYIKKLMQAQQKATFDKILNQTGRKFRQRQQKQLKQFKQKDQRSFKTLGDVPKIITKQTANNKIIYLHKTNLFEPNMLHQPNLKMGQPCQICHESLGKYKTRKGLKFCSVQCFKKIEAKQNIKKIYS